MHRRLLTIFALAATLWLVASSALAQRQAPTATIG
jgi:hypothetical protein